MITPAFYSGQSGIISVFLDNRRPGRLKSFHCPVCGRVVFEHFHSLRMLVPGQPGEIKAPTVVECNGAQRLRAEDGELVTAHCKTKFHVVG